MGSCQKASLKRALNKKRSNEEDANGAGSVRIAKKDQLGTSYLAGTNN